MKTKKKLSWEYIKKSLSHNWDLYLLILPVVTYYTIFHYMPMYGVQIAFKNFSPGRGILGSPWVGLKHFIRFFNSFYFERIIINTITITTYSIVAGFICPVLLALMLNEVTTLWYKKTLQTITYAPYFLSTVVMVGMIVNLFGTNGIINNIMALLEIEKIDFMVKPQYFKNLYVWSSVWQNTGWGSIIYLAALSGIDPNLHEAAKIDGAGRFRRIWHINIPGIMPTMTILLILSVGGIMNVGFEKIFLMQNDINLEASDVISTYVYRVGLLGAEYSFSAAIGLFNSVINFIILLIVNKIAKKIGSSGLF